MALSPKLGRYHRLLPNLGLALFLVAMTVLSLAHTSWALSFETLDVIAYTGATLLLVANTLRRPVARADDRRWWVWLACTASALSFLLYTGDSALLLAVIALHVFGDLGLVYLGSSFSILPARREIKRGLVYRIVRHPVYASYLVVDLVFVSQVPSLWNLAVAAIAIALLVLRARLEEEVLMGDPAYQDYCRVTRFRFVPGLY